MFKKFCSQKQLTSFNKFNKLTQNNYQLPTHTHISSISKTQQYKTYLFSNSKLNQPCRKS